METQVSGPRAADFILSEASGTRSRDNGILAASQDIKAGQILAEVTVATDTTVTFTADAGNTGNGVLTLANPTFDKSARAGDYRVVAIEGATNAGKFRVEDPTGVEIGTATVGQAFAKGVRFTIADGATDFVAGDGFTISVVKGKGGTQFVAFDPAATDGAQKPAALSIYPAKTGAGQTLPIVTFARDGEIKGGCIAWPAGISAAKKTAAIASLARFGLIVR